MAQRTIKASCLCKGVIFSITGQDKGGVLCHCVNCKKFTGSAFAHNYRMLKAKVEYEKGQDLVRSWPDRETKSGKALERFFCSRCVSGNYSILVCFNWDYRVTLIWSIFIGLFTIQLTRVFA